MANTERPHEVAGHKRGFFVVDGKIEEVNSEEECYRLGRDPDYPAGQVFWTKQGAEAELERLRGEG